MAPANRQPGGKVEGIVVTIQQFNGTYVPAEDRLLFRFNTDNGEEYRLWLTRRVTFTFLEASRQHAVRNLTTKLSEPAAKTVDAFQQEALQSKSDFNTPFQAATALPMGEEPLLAVDVKITAETDTTPPMNTVTFALAIGKNLNLTLHHSAINALRMLLDKLQDQAQWTAPLETGEAVLPVITPPSPSMH